MTFETIIKEVRALPVEARKQLVYIILDTLGDNVKTHDILEFRGIGAHLADDEDPQDYVQRLRSEWDERP
jgi:hypothetical protein